MKEFRVDYDIEAEADIIRLRDGSAYPNPGSSLITIPYHLASEKAAELHIFNSNGILVRSIPVGPHFDKVTIDVSNLQPGVYIYECEGKTNKFVVQ